MALKQLNDVDRILFLQYFAGELIKSSTKDREIKQAIEAEKIKKKFLEPIQENIEEIPIDNFIFKSEFEKSNFSEEFQKKEPINRDIKLPRRITNRIQGHPEKTIPRPSSHKISQKKNFSVDKINPLINDSAVQMIECSGPGKSLAVKVRNKIKITKITLSEIEIKEIIDYFSREARIPVIGGILKAAVNDLIISGVVSEFVGPRFIITKKSPYSLIEGVEPRGY